MGNPLITVGLPVYNGENYLEQAVNSILAQDLTDFELIIRDNASTDGTEAICRDFARRDDRVRYIRNPRNCGAAPNFNALVHEARGQYFKWMTHDDSVEPQFLSACLRVLEEEHSAVLACPTVMFIDSNGTPLEQYISAARTDDPDRVVRFESIIYGHRCFEVFGLIRLARLRETGLIAGYNFGDGILLAHLALFGRFAVVPQPLFLLRRHEQQSTHVFGVTNVDSGGIDGEAWARWFDHRNSTGVSFSYHRALRDLTGMVTTTPMSHRERLRCYEAVFGWSVAKWRCIAGEWKRSIYRPLGLDTRPRNFRVGKPR